MQKFEVVVIHMNIDLSGVELVSGSIDDYMNAPTRRVFAGNTMEFLAELSNSILNHPETKSYPDLMSVGFAIRPSNIQFYLKNSASNDFRRGRGRAFHITPSNVPLNFVFSYVFSLLAGNSNLVRLPSKAFPQIELFVAILNDLLKNQKYDWVRESTCFVRYAHNKIVTDYFSSTCQARIVWGGDTTIRDIQMSELPLRSIELNFPDRYSISILNASSILMASIEIQSQLALKFFTDSYLFDQQGCSSPKLVCWFGIDSDIEKAKDIFWRLVWKIAETRYDLQIKNAVDKFVDLCRTAAGEFSIESITMTDSFLSQISVNKDSPLIGDFQGQFGTFVECDLSSWTEFQALIGVNFQTMTYFGFDVDTLRDMLSEYPVNGLDRIVPVGQAFDITINWDGINFVESLSRIIDFR